MKPHRARLAVGTALTAASCLLALPVPVVVQWLVDRVARGPAGNAVLGAVALLAAVYGLQSLAGLLSARVLGGVAVRVAGELRRELYGCLQRLSLSYFDRTPVGHVISRVMDDVTFVQSLISGPAVTALTDVCTALAVAVLLFRCDALVAGVVAAVIPLHVLAFRAFAPRIRGTSREVRGRLDGVFSQLKQKVDGAMLVKVHVREDAEVAEFSGQIRALVAPRVRLDRLTSGYSSVCNLISGAGMTVVFGVGCWEVVRGRMTPGGVATAAALAAMLFGPVARLADVANLWQQASASLDRLAQVLSSEAREEDPEVPVANARPAGLVEFDGVRFGYHPEVPTLTDVTLRVEPGMKVAVVGPTGSGKSTLASLLLRFYEPTGGEIRLDGVPLTSLRRADLRSWVGIVPQEPTVLHMTVADNIRYGSPLATQEQVEAAAAAALVHDFARSLPQGYRTVIGEGGYRLSLGERQRLSIARALCKDPAIVVLDEATSSLDQAAETLIQRSLQNLLRGRTSITIAHRLATILASDLIVVMDGGRVAQLGRHEDLVREQNGLYATLCRRQFGDGGEPNTAPSWADDPTLFPSGVSGTAGRLRVPA